MALLALPSCHSDNPVINEDFEIVTPADPAAHPDIEEVTAPTAFIGNFGGSDADIKACFTDIVAPDDAKVIVIESAAIQENEALLSKAYERGALIAVFNPDGSVVADWSERNDIFYAGPEKNEACAIYGFNNRGTYYSLHGMDGIDDEDIPLFHFCGWVNKVAGSAIRGVDLRTKEIKKRFMPQNVTHTFKIALDEQKLIDGHWANPEQLSLTTTANVSYNIYPLRVFDGNVEGEYYAVEAEMTLHNAPMNNGLWTRRRGNELAQICGFYLNSCDVTANLLRKENGNYVEMATAAFANGAAPQPASMPDAATYDSGFEWNLDATVSGGVPDGKDNDRMTTFNNWIWKNQAEETLPGIELKNNSGTANVAYSLLVNGLPGATDNLTITPVPDAATGDITFKYSWIWRVTDVDETSKEKLYMQVAVNPIYQAYQWITEGKMTIEEFENSVGQSKSTFKFPLTPPNRMATGSAIVRNTSAGSYYVGDIKFWRNTTNTDGEPIYVMPQTISSPSATGGSGVSATMVLLPAGDYTIKAVRYSVENGEHVNEQIITNTTPITVSVGGTANIDFGSDLFTVM